MPDDLDLDRPSKHSQSNGWSVNMWSLAYNGVGLTRKRHYCDIFPFGGEIDISSLTVVPMKYSESLKVPVADDLSLREYLISQGKKFYEHLSPKCVYHSGEVLEFPFQRVGS